MDRDHLEMMLNLSIDEAWEEGVEEFLNSFEDKGLDSFSEFLERVENKFSIMYNKCLDLVQGGELILLERALGDGGNAGARLTHGDRE